MGNDIKVVHLIAGSLSGGAARGAYWLHKGLLKEGVNSRIITSSTITLGEAEITSVAKGRGIAKYQANKEAERLLLSSYPNRKNELFSSGMFGYDLFDLDVFNEADIVHLHWINDNFIDISIIREIEKPIVWTMRDMWPMTGGCHYAVDCDKYVDGCGKCPLLKSDIERDLSTEIQLYKSIHFPSRIQFVGISNWLSDLANKSWVMNGKAIRTIHNCIDTESFLPISKSVAREILGLATRKRIIVFGASRVNDYYKGFSFIKQTLNLLNKEKYYLLIFGASYEEDFSNLGFEYKRLGYLNDILSMRIAYSSGDVFLCASIIEAFGKTVAESMACGTPVVCFDNAGPGEIVEHKISGYKAKPFSAQDMAKGIEYLCFSCDINMMSSASHSRIKNFFSCTKIAPIYKELYKSML
ncbi:glycosyltransferase [Bowmanella pacifica]|uniref:Glycosyl transferase n=1 Tax=Bowmanella pacifica TaxID=502051 RepID=A0A917Z362_9ALTE|nr:glycosyltransferase [Bowmanella pacifica]GGO73872.1 glycosyl transferase [Bowmanella pacifica]